MITEEPDRWLIIKLLNGHYRVFATWAGGYLDGDRHKLNSGIKKVEQDESYYYFKGYSGSCYKCHKKAYGIATSYGRNVLKKIKEQNEGKIEIMKDDVYDWEKEVIGETSKG